MDEPNQKPSPETPDEESASQTTKRVGYSRTQTVLVDETVLVENRLVAHKDNQYGNSFRILRSQLVAKMRKNNYKSIAIVGALPEVGKTMVAANLALSISSDKRHTSILLDIDLRRPRIADYFGLKVTKGIPEVLTGNEDFEDILQSPFDGMVVAPSIAYENVGELFSSPKLPSLLKEVSSRYEDRICVIDLPPLLGVADALEVVPHVDCVLMVLENGKTTKTEIAEMKRLLQDATIVGAVVNKSTDDLDHSKTYYRYYSDRDRS